MSNPIIKERCNRKVGRGDIIIDEVKVDRHIVIKPYECDVKKLNCASLCCMRGCIVTSKEVERLNKHLPEIANYLGAERRGIIEKNGTFLADCKKQCPEGCEIHPEEKKAVTQFLEKNEKPKCISYIEDGCIFLYNKEGISLCAIHSYALDNGIDLSEIKPLDCIQYPIYCYDTNKGQKKLAVQKNSIISNFPCMNIDCGDAMYKNLTHATKNLLGEEFSEKLARYAESGQMELFVRPVKPFPSPDPAIPPQLPSCLNIQDHQNPR